MKSAILTISAVCVIFMMPAAIASLDDYRSTEYEAEYLVITGIGETDADVVLTQDLFSNRTSGVTIVSDNEDDLPLPSDYESSTNTLTISGLNANDTRTLTITYLIDALSDYWAIGIATKIIPIFLTIGIMTLLGAAGYNALNRGD